MRISPRKRNPIIKVLNGTAIDLPVARNLRSFWNFGFLLRATLGLQILTGIVLARHYAPNIELAFMSVNSHIGRNVNDGWMLRRFHANTAGAFFICMYIHMGRGLYFGSYRNIKAWLVGVVIIVVAIGTAFFGYVLVWGQISYWAATVITNLLTAISYVGETLAYWFWGDYSVRNATLNRFFSFHFVCPFIIAAFTVVHLAFIHQKGSRNPTGLNSFSLKVPLHQYFTIKDAVALLAYMAFIGTLVLFFPTYLGDPENYNQADALVTPVHIKPEFYFLWAYAILRSVPNKLGGVVAIFMAIGFLGILPLINVWKPGATFHPVSQVLFWIFVVNFFILSFIGACPVEAPYEIVGRVRSCLYFLYFFLDPLVKKWVHNSLMGL